MLDVKEIFYSIQGEGPFAGEPCWFIRLAECPLRCPGCFVKNTKIRMADGSVKMIQDVIKGDFVLSYNIETGLFEPREVLKTMVRKSDDIYKVNTGLKDDAHNPTDRIYCTSEHPFLVKDKGWIDAIDLIPGDVLLHFSNSDHKKVFNPMFNEESVLNLKKFQATEQGQLNKERSQDGLRRVKAENDENNRQRMLVNNPMKDPAVAVKGFLNRKDRGKKTGTELQFEDIIEGLPISFVGDGSLILNNKIPDFVVDGQKKVIEVWSSTSQHGKERNSDSTYIDTRRKHFADEGYETLFVTFPEGRKDKAAIRNTVAEFIHNGEVVRSVDKIELGSKAWTALRGGKDYSDIDVYNFEVEGLNNYVANGKIVHNCDTDFKGGTLMKVDEIVAAMADHKPRLVVLTGGEPMAQDISELVFRIVDAGMAVQVETSGVTCHENNEDVLKMVTVVCSPKTSKLARLLIPHIDFFKYVVKKSGVDNDGLPESLLRGHTNVFKVYRDNDYLLNCPERIYISPLDEQDSEKNKSNLEFAAELCMARGWNLTIQLHKLAGLR